MTQLVDWSRRFVGTIGETSSGTFLALRCDYLATIITHVSGFCNSRCSSGRAPDPGMKASSTVRARGSFLVLPEDLFGKSLVLPAHLR